MMICISLSIRQNHTTQLQDENRRNPTIKYSPEIPAVLLQALAPYFFPSSRYLLWQHGPYFPLSLYCKKRFDMLPELIIQIGAYEGVDGWITCNKDDWNDISCVSKAVFGAEEDQGIDDNVGSPAQSVDYPHCHNHFCDAFTHSHVPLYKYTK